MIKALVISCMSLLALVSSACASSDVGEAEGHRSYPTHANEAKKVGRGLVWLGSGKIEPFIWSVYAERGRPGGPSCFAVRVIGPLHEIAGKQGGPEISETRCGLVPSEQARVISVPIPDGESWSAFDIGIAAYKGSVTKAQVMRSDGSSERIRTRHFGRDLSVPGLGSLHYGVFAVDGCVNEILGWNAGRVVATSSVGGCGTG